MKGISPAPLFLCKYSPQPPELLEQLTCTIVISSFQERRLIFLSSKDGKKITLAAENEVITFKQSCELAQMYSPKPHIHEDYTC